MNRRMKTNVKQKQNRIVLVVHLFLGKEQRNYENFRTIDGTEWIKISDKDGQGMSKGAHGS